MLVETLERSTVKSYTLEEYFEHEEHATQKSEFQDGKLITMAGGTFAHNTLELTISALLFMLSLEREDLVVFNSDQKIYLPEYNHGVYADVGVITGERQMYQGGNQAILNPSLIVEVLSNSTERYDRAGKFRKYQSIPSFQEYVLASQDTPIIDVLTREEEGWLMKSYIGLEEEVQLTSIVATLKMCDIYQKVENLKDPQTALEFNPDNKKEELGGKEVD